MVKLRFIGKPGGKLVKGAPGNYEQGQIVVGPSDRVENFPRIWALAEELPELIIPRETEVDSVFDPDEVESIEVEPEPEPVVEAEPEPEPLVEAEEEPIKLSKEYNLLDPDRESKRSFHRVDVTLDDSTYSSDDEVTVLEPLPTVEALQSWTKKQLMKFLDSQGAEYKQRMPKAEILEKAKSLL